MTLPEQSDRAVAQTREFLVRLASPYGEGAIKGIRREVRAEASRLLRHYPLSGNGDCPEPDNAATQDILTDEEREAIERSIRYWRGGFRPHPFAAVLSQLLRRLQQLK
jgi:hypothetical protein